MCACVCVRMRGWDGGEGQGKAASDALRDWGGHCSILAPVPARGGGPGLLWEREGLAGGNPTSVADYPYHFGRITHLQASVSHLQTGSNTFQLRGWF